MLEDQPDSLSPSELDQIWRNHYPELESAEVPPRPTAWPDSDSKQTAAVSGAASPANGEAVRAEPARLDEDEYFGLILHDGLSQPIDGLHLQVVTPTGTIEGKSSAHAAIAIRLPKNPTGTAELQVKDKAGAMQTVCKLDLAQCKGLVVARSPKVAASLTLHPHQQTPPPPSRSLERAPNSKPSRSAPWWVQNGALDNAWHWLSDKIHISASPDHAPHSPLALQTLNSAGQPVSVIVSPECPNKDNLILGRNNVYREALLTASKRLDLIPQALCALIECEAAKKTITVPIFDPKTHKQVKDKSGKPLQQKLGTMWDEHSGGSLHMTGVGVVKLGASFFGFQTSEVFVAQGHVIQSKHIFAPRRETLKQVFSIMESDENGGAEECDKDKTECYEMSRTISIDSSRPNLSIFPLVVAEKAKKGCHVQAQKLQDRVQQK